MYHQCFEKEKQRWICGICWDAKYRYQQGFGFVRKDNVVEVETGRKERDPYEQKGNLENTEYRFWVGQRIYVPYMQFNRQSMCRRCRLYEYGPVQRKEHREKYNPPCTIALNMAYKWLLEKADRQCIVCREKCVTTEWGVPLHRTMDCINTWRFSYTQHLLLEQALKQVGADFKNASQLLLNAGEDDTEVERRMWETDYT